jgi:hypothetical protein
MAAATARVTSDSCIFVFTLASARTWIDQLALVMGTSPPELESTDQTATERDFVDLQDSRRASVPYRPGVVGHPKRNRYRSLGRIMEW